MHSTKTKEGRPSRQEVAPNTTVQPHGTFYSLEAVRTSKEMKCPLERTSTA